MFERCLYFNINALSRVVHQHWAQAYQAVGLSPAHAYLLRVVLNQPGITQKQLAAELRLAPSTITRFADALCTRGLLLRQRTAGDAREAAIHPTEQARALHTDLERIGDELYHRLRTTLGETRLTDMVTGLRQTHDSLLNTHKLPEDNP